VTWLRVPCESRPAVSYDAVVAEIPDSHRDLLDAQFATLATIDDGGFPQLTEVWFLYEDGEVKLSLNTSRAKTRNLERRPECNLFLLDLGNPYRYLELRGRARLEPDADGAFAARVGAKYGADLQAYDAPGDTRVVVTIEPVRVRPVDMS
jgi:PPOX class probable F420-dependent enzyme